ncbi:MAG: AgmX/PglI C-terminal domain-containing protein [Polyangiaceae bacterium]
MAMCVATAHQIDPAIEGRVSVAFTIGLDGRVATASLASAPAGASGLGACLERAFEGLSFPKPDGGTVRVVYPFAVERDR